MEINNLKLKFRVKSDNKNVVVLPDTDDWLLETDTGEAFTNNIWIDILGKVDNSKKYHELGILYGRYFKINQIYDKQASLFEVFDSIDQDTYKVYQALLDEDGSINMDYCGIKSNIFHIEKLYIEEDYRKLGIGEKVLDYLNDILNYSLNCEVGCYILQPNPIIKVKDMQFEVIKDTDTFKRLKRKLLKFYRKCGYEKILDTDFMYINTDYVKVKRDH